MTHREGSESIAALALRPDGRIVAAGQRVHLTNYDFALAQYNPDGSLDSTFGSNGLVDTEFTVEADFIRGMALQPDGKIVVAGHTGQVGFRDIALARYSADGSLDPSFSGDGKLVMAIGTGDDEAHDVLVQPDGKILLAGISAVNNDYEFMLARRNPDGSPDTTFGGGDGNVTTKIGAFDSSAYAVLLQWDGKIVVGGDYSNRATLATATLPSPATMRMGVLTRRSATVAWWRRRRRRRPPSWAWRYRPTGRSWPQASANPCRARKTSSSPDSSQTTRRRPRTTVTTFPGHCRFTSLFQAQGVLANDADVDGDTLHAILVDPPAAATLISVRTVLSLMISPRI